MPKPRIKVFHDTRRAKAGGVYPVKIRVYHDGARRDYGIFPDKDREQTLDLNKADFQAVMYSQRPREAQRLLRDRINAVYQRAKDIAEDLPAFSFDTFERKYTGEIGEDNDLIYQYDRYINWLKKQSRYGTASNYDLSLKSIKAFVRWQTGTEPTALPYSSITVEWLNDYESKMLADGYSKATIGIYLRPLRAMFNYALDPVDYISKKRAEPFISREIYPFGERLYVIPTGSKVKKSLDMADLGKLYTYKLEPGTDKERARDFFFFSYAGNGMNTKDIATLKVKNVQGNVITFERSKTIRTTKAAPISIIVPIVEHIAHVIEKYGTRSKNPEAFLFDILTPEMSAAEQYKAAKAFTRYVNQHMKALAKDAGVTEAISTNWGRHSFTTNAIRQGAAMEFIKDSLGHKNLKTTENYWGGFAENAKKNIAEGLMNFGETEAEKQG